MGVRERGKKCGSRDKSGDLSTNNKTELLSRKRHTLNTCSAVCVCVCLCVYVCLSVCVCAISCKDPADILAASSSLFSLATLSPPVPAYPVCGLDCDLARYGEGSHYRAGASSAATAAASQLDGRLGGARSDLRDFFVYCDVCVCVCLWLLPM